MKFTASVLVAIYVIGLTIAFEDKDRLVDPASRQLSDFKEWHPNPAVLTTSAGKPVDIRETNTFNSELLSNAFFIDGIKHVVSERIPQREANPKGAGAHGYFEVINDVTKYTKAKLFESVGKKTPVFARFGTGATEKGQTDASPVTIRGVSFKFYTEEGNFDLLNVQIPVYIYRDPILFPVAMRSFRPNPKHYITTTTSTFDFVTHYPQSIHAFLWITSEFGLPRGFRHMNAFPIHVFEIYNNNGESYFVRFKFLAEQGYESLTLQEAANVTMIDPDFFIRDLYNSIERQDYPAWRLEMDVLNENQLEKANFNPFDVTQLWPNGTYHTVPIGRVVLNRNVENYFEEVEQAAFAPSNLVPGIKGPPDMLFKGRVIAYADAHTHRLGINHNKIKINCPMNARTYNRDGQPPVLDNERDAPNYFPNSFNGPVPYVDKALPKHRIMPLESNEADYKQANRFYNKVLVKESQKQRLIDNLVQNILRVEHPVQNRFTKLLSEVDNDLAKRFSVSLAFAKKTNNPPSLVSDLETDKRNPCDL